MRTRNRRYLQIRVAKDTDAPSEPQQDPQVVDKYIDHIVVAGERLLTAGFVLFSGYKVIDAVSQIAVHTAKTKIK